MKNQSTYSVKVKPILNAKIKDRSTAKSERKIQYQTKLEKQVKVNFAMAECCHYRHGNAAESEIKNEFQTKLATRASVLSSIKPMVPCNMAEWRQRLIFITRSSFKLLVSLFGCYTLNMNDNMYHM